MGVTTAEVFVDFSTILIKFILVLRNLPPVGREVTLVERT
jgi:hypothetical protein